MRVDSYAQTPTSRGAAHKALSVLMALVLALGLMPISHGQAWAVDDTLVLAAGAHQGSGATELTCKTGDNSVTLYAQIQDFATGGTSYVSGGANAYGSGFGKTDCENFKVTWYKDSVDASNVMETQTLGWNDTMSSVKWTTDFQKGAGLYNAEDGVYKFYAVATYGSQSSSPLEFTVTKGDVSTSKAYELTGVSDPAGAAEVTFQAESGGDITEAEADEAVVVKVATSDKTTYPLDSVKLNITGVTDYDDVSEAQDVSGETFTKDVKYFQFTMPAQAVTVTVNFGGGTPSVQTVNVNFEVRSEDNTYLYEDDDYTVAVKDSKNADAPSEYNQSKLFTVFTLTVGETYTYTLTPAYGKEGTYATTTGTFTVAADQGTVKSVTMNAAGTEPTSDPVLTLAVVPSNMASHVTLRNGNTELTLDEDSKVTVAGKTRIEVATSGLAAAGYQLKSIVVTGAEVDEYGYFNMPSTDATCTVTLEEAQAYNLRGGDDSKYTVEFQEGTYFDEDYPEDNITTAKTGDKVCFKVTPKEGYKLKTDVWGDPVVTITDDEGEISQNYGSSPNFTVRNGDVTVSAEVEEVQPYKVSVADASGIVGGKIALESGVSTFYPGSTFKVTVTPDADYALDKLTFKSGDEDVASSTVLGYARASYEPSEDDDDVYIVQIASDWDQEDDWQGTPAYGDLVISASFKQFHAVAVDTVENGYFELTDGEQFIEGTIVNFRAHPDAGYTAGTYSNNKMKVLKAEDGSDTGISVGIFSGGLGTFRMPDYPVILSGEFMLATYSVNTTAYAYANGKGSVSQEFAEGQTGKMDDTCILTVKTESGYALSSIRVSSVTTGAGDPELTRGDDDADGNATYTFTMPASDVTVYATFLPVQTIGGTASYSKTYAPDMKFNLDATVETGDGELSFASSDTSIATVGEDGEVTITGAGDAVITVTAAGTDNYAPATKEIAVSVAEGANNMTAVAASPTITRTYSIEKQLIEGAITVSGESDDGVTYLKKFGNSGIEVDEESGKITLSAGLAAGTYPVRVIVMDMGGQNYAMKAAAVSLTIVVDAVDLTGKALALESATATYNGAAQAPVVATVGGKALAEGDYTVTYRRGAVVTDDLVSAGKVTVSVTGKGNCKGTSASATYTIAKADVADAAVTLSAGKFTYNGNVQAPEVKSVKVGDYELASDELGIAFSNAQSTDADTYSITLTGKGSNVTGTKTVEYTIAKRSIANKTVVLNSATLIYNKNKQEPVVKTVGGLKLKKGTDYTMSYKKGKTAVTAANVKAVGTYTLTVTGIGNYTGNATAVTFKIQLNKNTLAAKAANPTVVLAKVSKAAQSAVVGSVSNVGQGTLKVENVSTDKTAKKWKVAYNKKTKKITVTVPKKTAKNTKGYALKVKVTTPGNATYAPGTVTLTPKVVVK